MIVAMAAAGEPVELRQVMIAGDLDLSGVGRITAPFRCIDCTVSGEFIASDVVFERVVDLSGLRTTGLNLRAAAFEAPLIITGGTSGASIDGPVDASVVVFKDLVNLEGVRFGDTVSFANARFLGNSSFSGTDFVGSVDFGRAESHALTLFTVASSADPPDGAGSTCQMVTGSGHFLGEVSFERATFHDRVDFRRRCFEHPPLFIGATFSGVADFTQSLFGSGEGPEAGKTSFDGADFASRGSFLAAVFISEASFADVTGAGGLDFTAGQFERDALFFRTRIQGPLTFDRTLFRGGLVMNQVSADPLELDLSAVASIESSSIQEEVLRLIERGARDKDDFATANDALFKRRELEGAKLNGLSAVFDALIVNRTFGYFVRPTVPLIPFALLLVLGAVTRTSVLATRDLKAPPLVPRPTPGRLESAFATTSAAIAATLKAAVGGLKAAPSVQRSADERAARPYLFAGILWIEFILFRVFGAAFIIALANSNPTFRSMFDAAF